MKMRKGFTLVELLIVIIIIGILASAMLLSSGSATDSAVASKIASNLRTVVSAVLMYRGDNNGAMPTALSDINSYLGGAAIADGYSLENLATNAPYAKYADAAVLTAGVKEKLAKLALKEKGLLGADGNTYTVAQGDEVRMSL